MAAYKISRQLALFLFLGAILCLPIPKAGMMPFVLPVFIGVIAIVFLLSYVEYTISEYKNSSSDLLLNNKTIFPWVLVYLTFLITFCITVWMWPVVFGWERFLGADFDKSTFGALTNIDAFGVSKLRSLSLLGLFSVLWFACWRSSVLTKEQIKWLVWIVFLASLFQVFFGLWHFLSKQTSVLGLWDKQYYLKDVTGTFVNHNHFAGFLAICWPIVLSGLLSSNPMILTKVSQLGRFTVAVFFSLLVFLAIIASHSRMGLVASLLGVIVWFYLHSRGNLVRKNAVKQGYSRFNGLFNHALLKWFVSIVFLLFIIWFGIEDLLERYLALEDGDSRFDVWRSMFDLPFSGLLLGIGPGAFADVFPLVQPSYYKVHFEYAHNDYLEFIFEFGLLGTSLIIISLLYWCWKAFPRGDFELRAGACGAVAAMILHSMVDFNLQIPASALYFWVAVGLVMNPNLLSNENGCD